MWLVIGRPIVAVDHDLWFHLAHGRTIVEQGEIPRDSYFSFLSPARRGIDYYWLFQPLVYGTYAVAGYPGLIALRALLFGGLMLAVGVFLFRGSEAGRQRIWLCLVFGLTVAHLVQRTPSIRPHSLSFLLIVLCLLLLDKGGKWVLALPLLAVVWTNVHGIEYPVMLLILGAYAAGLLLERRGRGGAPAAGEQRTLAALGLAMAAVFVTPHGLALLRLPFQAVGSISWVIEEMERLPWSHYLKLDLSSSGLSSDTQFNLLLALAVFSTVSCLLRRRARASHLILFAGGVFLLTRGYRFAFECALLSLPVLRSAGDAETWPEMPAGVRRLPVLALAVGVLALPALSLARQLPQARDAWPLSLHNLPHGIAAFLRQADVEGTVMNSPRYGGYLFWSLYPAFRISMDLEVAFLFDERDLFEVESAYLDPAALGRYLERRPSFIAAPVTARRFPELIRAHPQYRAVCFDDTNVLYVDAERHPEIAARWQLAAIDPFTAGTTRFSALSPAARERVRQELERIVEIDPRIAVVNQSLAILANLEGRHQDALRAAERTLEREPLAAQSHALVGDALTGLGQLGDAEAAYRRAYRHAHDDEQRRSIGLSLAGVLNARGRGAEAYESFAAAVGEFGLELSSRELHRLGVLAAKSGQPEKARRFFELARWKAPPADETWRRQLEAALAAVDGER